VVQRIELSATASCDAYDRCAGARRRLETCLETHGRALHRYLQAVVSGDASTWVMGCLQNSKTRFMYGVIGGAVVSKGSQSARPMVDSGEWMVVEAPGGHPEELDA
jgi:hypothetical protein